MAEIDWGPWKPGSIEPKMMLDVSLNFETRRILGIWEFRTGTTRQPTIDQICVYGQKNGAWKFSEDQHPADTHFINIETADGLPTGKIQIGTV
jgi:hypothetical protein